MRQAQLALLLLVMSVGSLDSRATSAQSPTVEQLVFQTNPGSGVRAANISATLHLPRSATPVSVMVIISSSGGVIDWIEGYYARELGRHGIGALVVDSFKPRGVHKVIEDQSLVTSWDMENDAFAALELLRKDKRIDPAHIGIMGLSKGGLTAQNAAFQVRRAWRRTGDLAFAAHVAIGADCAGQHRDARTTGRPLLYLHGELDDYNLVAPCTDYVARIRDAGNPNVTLKIYKGAQHNWEDTKPVSRLSRAENYSKCFAVIEDDGAWVMNAGKGPKFASGADIFAWRRANCMTIGAHVGGGTDSLKREAIADIVGFLKRAGF